MNQKTFKIDQKNTLGSGYQARAQYTTKDQGK